MRYLNKLVWATIIMGASASPIFAQGGGGGGGAAGGGGGGAAGAGGGAAGGAGGSTTGTSLTSLSATPQITAPTASGGNTGNSVSTSNFLSMYYANPYYQGILTNSQSNNNSPGGFGAQLFGTSGSTSGGGQIGFAGGAGGATGSTAVRGGATGNRSGSSTSNTTGIVIPLPVQISYAARLSEDFVPPPLAPGKLQADIISTLRNTRDITYPATIQLGTDGSMVIVRGTAKNAGESKYIEGLIRSTPGVQAVKNELTVQPK